MFRNSLFRYPPIDPVCGQVMPSNIDFIGINSDKSMRISKSIWFSDKIVRKEYLIEKLSHIKIALKVLQGEVSAQDGIDQLCHLENPLDIYSAEKLPLGDLLTSLLLHSMPGNKKIRYIDSEVEMNIKLLMPIEENHQSFALPHQSPKINLF